MKNQTGLEIFVDTCWRLLLIAFVIGCAALAVLVPALLLMIAWNLVVAGMFGGPPMPTIWHAWAALCIVGFVRRYFRPRAEKKSLKMESKKFAKAWADLRDEIARG